MFKAGFAEADITPDNKKAELSGQYYQRISEGIHSRIKTVAFVFESDDNVSAMISLDVVSIPEFFYEKIRRSVSEKIPAIKTNRIILNATHTHSAPCFKSLRNWWPIDKNVITEEEFTNFVETKILDAVSEAWQSRKNVSVAKGFDNVPVGHCRRAVYNNSYAEMYGDTSRDDFTGMESAEDSGVEMLFFFGEDEKPRALIINVACPSQVMESTYKISSDYMGAVREKLKKEYGENFQTLCLIGAGGCQSPRDLVRNKKSNADFWCERGVETISEKLFSAVKNSCAKASSEKTESPEMVHIQKEILLPQKRVSYNQYIAAKKDLELLQNIKDEKSAYKDFCDKTHTNEKAGGSGPYDSKLHHFVKIKNLQADIARYEEQDENVNLAIDVHILRIGDCVFATNPFELYLDFGLQIKARSCAEQTFIIQLANGCCGYLPSKAAEEFGGYGGRVINGRIGSDGGKKLVDETVNIIYKAFE